MCGRYVSPEEAAIEREWHVGRETGNPFPRRFNVRPTMIVPILRRVPAPGGLEIAAARWGLIPNWWKEDKPPKLTFNARSEEAASRPMWKTALARARCLIPAEGWYEWQAVERIDAATGEVRQVKQPHYIHLRDGGPFCFAGLMSVWSRPGEEIPLLSCSILTKDAAPSVAAVHNRMPIALPNDAHAAWLDPEWKDAGEAIAFARGRALAEFDHHPVSMRLNAAKDDDPSLIEAVR